MKIKYFLCTYFMYYTNFEQYTIYFNNNKNKNGYNYDYGNNWRF